MTTPAALFRTAELLAGMRRSHAYGGVLSTLRPLLYGDDGVFPHFTAAAEGCRITDTTGGTYIDWLYGGGAVLLGYRRPEVEAAILRQLASGPLVTFTSPVELELATALTEIIPCAEQVAFGKNGSDALTAAVRIARAVTGREMILFYGFHGFHDWYAATGAGIRGIPRALRRLTLPFPYNDAAALEALLAKHTGKVAAVVMEPTKNEEPLPGYLESVRRLAHEHGALLVFDEVVTSLRLAPAGGGAQDLYGVIPDLACVGKALGNGMPISAVVGRREYMQHFPDVGVGMTFQGETLSFAAALATLEIVRREPVAAHVAVVGERVRQAFDAECARLGFECRLAGHPSRMWFSFAAHADYPNHYLLGLFITECLKRGVVTNGSLIPSYAHDEGAIDETCAALAGAIAAVAEATRARIPMWTLPGDPRSEGYIDSVIDVGDGLRISGWLLLEGAPAAAIELIAADGTRAAAETTPRPDVARVLGGAPEAADSGFAVTLPAAAFAFAPGGRGAAVLHARARDGRTLRCVLHYSSAIDAAGGEERAALPIAIAPGALLLL